MRGTGRQVCWGVVIHTFNPSTRAAEAGGSEFEAHLVFRVESQGCHTEKSSQKKKKRKREREREKREEREERREREREIHLGHTH